MIYITDVFRTKHFAIFIKVTELVISNVIEREVGRLKKKILTDKFITIIFKNNREVIKY